MIYLWILTITLDGSQTDSDSQLVKLDLTKTTQFPSPNGVLVEKCKELIWRDWEIEVIHIYLEANTVADMLANWALQHQIGYYLLISPLLHFAFYRCQICKGSHIPVELALVITIVNLTTNRNFPNKYDLKLVMVSRVSALKITETEHRFGLWIRAKMHGSEPVTPQDSRCNIYIHYCITGTTMIQKSV